MAGNGAADAAAALGDFDGISYAKGSAILKQLNATIGSYLARVDVTGENALIPEEQRQKNGKPWIPGAYKGYFIEQFVSQVLQK